LSLGRQFLSALLAEKTISALIKLGAIDHLFKDTELPAFQFIVDFATKHAALPHPDTVAKETGDVLAQANEPPSYYLAHMQTRWKERQLKLTVSEIHKALEDGGGGVDAATAAVSAASIELLRRRYATQLVDLRDAHDAIVAAYKANHKPNKQGLFLGWPTLDSMTNGLQVGDTVAYVGRPGIGKTWQMLYGALYGWRRAEADDEAPYGSSRLFVSMEMGVLPVEQRLVSMFTHLNVGDIKTGSLDSLELRTLQSGLMQLQGAKAPFYVVDGNLSATVDELELLVRHLKPDALFIDGAYLLKHPTERDRYKRVAENADLLKQRIASEFCPVVCSWQFKRAETKKKAASVDDVTLDDIAYADAIGQVSSLVLGLFEADDVETIKQRRVKVLKGRSGETGEFYAKWDFKNMDFSEVQAKEVGQLSFVD